MLIYLFIIILLKTYFKSYYKKYDYHSLFRSFFCFGISTLSLLTTILYWNNLILNPFDSNWLSIHINKLMLTYMLYDTAYYIYSNKYRIDLLIHHIICIGFFGIYYNKLLLTFCSINEIISAFNWIGILYPNYSWIGKLIRLYSILFVRLFVWIYTLYFIHNDIFIFYIGLLFVSIFIGLDLYWISIILNNYFNPNK